MLAHRSNDSAWILLPPRGGNSESRIRASHPVQRHSEHYDTAAVHRLSNLPARDVGPERDLVENAALDLVSGLLVTTRRPTLLVRERHHRRVLTRAIVVKPRRAVAGFSHDFGAALRRRLVRTAGEISFLEPDVVEHLLHQGDVLWLATVRRARDCELLVAPAQRLESARGEKRQHLERLGTGSPVGERVSVARGAEELVPISDYRGVYPVLRFDRIATGYSNIKLVRFDHTE